jgi:1,2-diacylglycerol 3-beta-galactosyltransferase
MKGKAITKRVTLLYIDSGGGHRAAATALAEVIRQQQRPWDLRMVSIQDLFDPIDFIQKYTGIRFQEIYNIILRRGWTFGSASMIALMHFLVRLTHKSQVEVMRRYWRESQPDLVVSLIPHFNRSIAEALDAELPGTPYVTVLTDIADYPPHFWIEGNRNVICGSARAAEQARDLGVAPHRIFRASGMILNPRFYETPEIDRNVERIRLGLRPNLPTGLVLFGGEGSEAMLKIVRALNRPRKQLQLILLCGKNERLAAKLRAIPKNIPLFVQGFTRDVPFYMELSDFFVGKPGPGSISEALAKQLPVIVQRNAWTLAHERYNAEWIEEQEVGLVVRDFTTEIEGAVETLLQSENYVRFRYRAAALQNNAVFEIPDMLEEIMISARSSQADKVSAG